MLSPPGRDDEDDDTHLCIKCNITIIGLSNYIKHRKEKCGKKYDSVMKTPKPELHVLDPFELSYSLGADLFFQSLELQSSVKKSSLSRLTPPLPSKPPIPSTTDSKSVNRLDSNLRGEDWIGGDRLRISHCDDNQTKLINAVASISETPKKDLPSTSYNIESYNDYKDIDESDDTSDDTEEDEDEEDPNSAGGKWKPPIDHTGGKWKPPIDHTGGKWRLDSPEHEYWDLKEDQDIGSDIDRDDEFDDGPPPSHTKGKWVPGAQEQKIQIMATARHTKSSVQYWCGPCNRRLTSRVIYEKHLKSNIHYKNMLPEQELEFSGDLEPPPIPEKRLRLKPSRLAADSEEMDIENIEAAQPHEITKKRKKRKPIFVSCPGCKSRVRLNIMGKHLISHYHFRKARNVAGYVYQNLILGYIDYVVRQSPFQCSPCKFFTNWHHNFVEHWQSKSHEDTVTKIDGKFWCSFCKFECEESEQMLRHLIGTNHVEVVALINRSMPIVIRKKSVIKCSTCLQEFRFNFQLKKHCERTGHEVCETATDSYQGTWRCSCPKKFKTSLALAAHLKAQHEKTFVCMVCAKSFETPQEAKQHRQTAEHKVKTKEKQISKGLRVNDLKKKCPYCINMVLKNVIELKKHIQIVHPNIKKKCPKCGMTFTLPQEVTWHIRNNACQFKPKSETPTLFETWNCDQCLFSTESKAESYFHEVLHKNQPIVEVKKRNKLTIRTEKYPCPFCSKTFKKASLRHHLNQHTKEKPYVCTICSLSYGRQSSLANHLNIDHALNLGKSKKKLAKLQHDGSLDTRSNEQKSLAAPCNVDFTNKRITESNEAKEIRKINKKDKPNESTKSIGQTQEALEKPNEEQYFYQCPHCHYICKSVENLRKHVTRRHRGLPLYTCQECQSEKYQTNMARDLRNHLYTAHNYKKSLAVDMVKWQLKVACVQDSTFIST